MQKNYRTFFSLAFAILSKGWIKIIDLDCTSTNKGCLLVSHLQYNSYRVGLYL